MKTLKSFLTLTTVCGLTALAVNTSWADSLGRPIPSGGIATGGSPLVTPPAAPPSNLSITNPITGSSNVLWDVSLLTNKLQNLDLSLDTGHGSTIEITWADPFTQNGRGKLAGSGTNALVTVLQDGGSTSNAFIGKYTSSGSITSSKGVAHVTFSARVSGSLLFNGDTRPRAVSASGVYTAKFDANTDAVTGHYSEHASAAGKGSASQSGPLDTQHVSELVPELGDGTWTLQIDFLTADGNKLNGSAWVTLNSGQVYPFTFTGLFNPNNNQSKLNLKGNTAGQGSTLQVVLDGTDIIKITGQVSGQSVNIK